MTFTLRSALAALGAALLLGAASAQAPGPLQRIIDPRSEQPMSQRLALLELAERALAAGNPAYALIGFERAAMMLHAGDTEMGLVRAWMQSGDYRRALTFSAHTAGAHKDMPAAAGLYAWLLRAGGQEVFAQRVLSEGLQRSAADPVLLAVQQAFQARVAVPAPDLLALPHRMAPMMSMAEGQTPPPVDAQVLGTAVLLGDGQTAVALQTIVQAGRQIWVRNGLGRTTMAEVQDTPQALSAQGFVLLRLAVSVGSVDLALAPRDPFAGSQGFTIAYSAQSDGTPAWPLLQQGFFGGADGSTGMRKLGIPMPGNAASGLVLDASGHLAGVAFRTRVGQAAMLPASVVRGLLAEAPPDAALPQPPARIPADEAFERGMRHSLQVIALP